MHIEGALEMLHPKHLNPRNAPPFLGEAEAGVQRRRVYGAHPRARGALPRAG